MNNYIKLNCEFDSDKPELAADIIIAELNEYNFESYEKSGNKLFAYTIENNFSDKVIKKLEKLNYPLFTNLKSSIEVIPQKNWNNIWESNFNPILINKKCIIKAPFHKNTPKAEYEIIIEPKMSFGTGHHETTSLMIKNMLQIDFSNKNVLDIGCGTGILSILASKLNAKNIYAIDIDKWAYQNTLENCKLNNIKNIKIIHGEIQAACSSTFDIILANINLNVIFSSISKYANLLVSEGWLIVSGFFENEIKLIQNEAKKHGLYLSSKIIDDNWAICVFIKN